MDQFKFSPWKQKAKDFIRIGTVLLMMIVMVACGGTHPEAVDIKVDFSWHSTKDAGRISPEINLNGIPDGTKQFLVALKDLTLVRDHLPAGLIHMK